MKPAPPVTLTLTGIAHGGEAFGHHQGKIVFVPYAIPGETVQVEISEDKPKWARARLRKVLRPSPDRRQPPCPYFGPGRCGGCQWQHIAYERQLALKQEVLADQLRRLGGIADPPVLDIIALADDDGLRDYGYRNHVQLATAGNGRLGFVREGAEMGREATDVIAIDECLLLHPLVDELHQALRLAQSEDRAEEEGEAVRLQRVSLRAGLHSGQQLLVFETADDRAPGLLVEEWTVAAALKRGDGSTLGLIGDPWLEETVGGRTFRVSAASFFQVNTIGAEAMVDLAGDMLAPQGHETLLDAYCGVGLFGLSLAGQVREVVGVESSPSACDDFAWNARDLNHVSLFEGAVAEVLAALPAPGDERQPDSPASFDLAILDPPRSGAGPDVVAQIARLGIPRLLYISCDPATLARDARLLLATGYHLRRVQPIDLFPQTFHLESLALFERP
ncbi:MAG: 23S rRNA (uracil(1939)-C(5))-methyltransferase RlmD [Caldilineales bacterium]|nr:23S rRNA (uracil(1939)-C(5))-methyltransferase RlmD [Caldilineales bacterium]MCW5857092.1 23S rRNA (uracil(1939)-C(5))-methyltransferase RlmD [Caldilineales bacterium]